MIASILRRQLTQVEAASQLHLSVRQVKRLVRAYRIEGIQGLASKHRGKPANNAIDTAVRSQALDLMQTRYADFGVTLAHEKLTEEHGMRFSVETMRQWMIAEGLWQPKRRRSAKVHQRRPRRPRFGELIQIDGSPHDWFEGRGARCTLIVFIDDATSQLTALRFAPVESTKATMETLREHLARLGRPVSIYSDKHSIFRVNRSGQEGNATQFTRVLKTLDIAPIHANTPQAKGRVERANQTLQDRLVKALRLAGKSTIEQANDFLPGFMEDYNRRFAVEPQHPEDAHREVLHTPAEQEQIVCFQYQRKLSKNLTLPFDNTEYQLRGAGKGYRLRGATVTLCHALDGSVTLLYKGRSLAFGTLQQGEAPLDSSNKCNRSPSVDLKRGKAAENFSRHGVND